MSVGIVGGGAEARVAARNRERHRLGGRSIGFWLAVGLLSSAVAVSAGAAVVAERVEIPSGEWRLVGDLVVPEAAGRVPVALLLNQAAGDRSVYGRLAEELARRGIASLRLDLRGHGESTNVGRFVAAEGTAILDGTPLDVAAALEVLRSRPGIDAGRIAVVGASYSGEKMMEAARAAGFATAYVGLSPGSLSGDSIDAIDRQGFPFLLVTSRDERWMKEVAAALRERSRSAHFLELDGSAHATDLLDEHPGLAGIVAEWIEGALLAAGTAGER